MIRLNSNSIENLLNLATHAFEQELWDDSEEICKLILYKDFQHFKATQLLGLIAINTNCYLKAIDYLYKANELHPNNLPTLLQLGLALCLDQQFQAGIAIFDQVINIDPRCATAYCDRGSAFKSIKDYPAAIDNYQIALDIDTQNAVAHFNKGLTHFELNEFELAIQCYLHAISIDPNYLPAYINQGIAYRELQQYDKAIQCYSQALKINPDNAQAYFNMAVAFKDIKQFDAAISSYDIAIHFNPQLAAAYLNRGILLQDFRKFDAAMEDYNKVVELEPNLLDGYFNKSTLLLSLGNYDEGWRLYESRLQKPYNLPLIQRLRKPKWTGIESLANKTILLIAEQGLGDTIQFCRYIPLLAELGATVILQVQQSLTCILTHIKGVSQVITKENTLPAYDFYCLLMSLPFAFKTNLNNIPQKIPYIHTDQNKINFWRQQIEHLSGPKVGLVWSGGHRPSQPHLWATHKRRDLPFEKIAALNIPEAHFFSLQKGEPAESELPAEQLQYWNTLNFHNFSNKITDFTDTAAMIKNLDLIISVDTSTAHLSGALGKPTWILNRYDSCWRWLLDTPQTPWYPSARLYRQQQFDHWDELLIEVRSDLIEFSKAYHNN